MATLGDEVIGFAGLGLMGFPMAVRICRAGAPLAAVCEALSGWFAASRLLDRLAARCGDGRL